MAIFLATRDKILDSYETKDASFEHMYDLFADVRRKQKELKAHTLAVLIIDNRVYAAFEAWECTKNNLSDADRFTHHTCKDAELRQRFAAIWKLPQFDKVR